MYEMQPMVGNMVGNFLEELSDIIVSKETIVLQKMGD